MASLICNDAVEMTAVEGEVCGYGRTSMCGRNLVRQLCALAAFSMGRQSMAWL